MDEQLTLMGFDGPEANELRFLDSIFPQMQKIVADKFVPVELLIRDPKASGYTVVSYHGLTVFRLKLRGKKHYISVLTLFSDVIPKNCPTQTTKSDENYIRILVDQDHPIESYTDFLLTVTGASIDRLPKVWDCCSRYMECSDAKTCVHPDKVFALDCGYRKILNSGRIFYGKNRNID